MKLSKILKNLDKYLHKAKASNAVRCDQLDSLLDELKSKGKKTEKALAKEKGGTERKQLKLELKMIKVELRKAKERRKELSAKCK